MRRDYPDPKHYLDTHIQRSRATPRRPKRAGSQYHEILQSTQKAHEHHQRGGMEPAFKFCPPITLLFSVLAWYSFCHSDGFIVGICYLVGAIAFLAMLVLGAIFA